MLTSTSLSLSSLRLFYRSCLCDQSVRRFVLYVQGQSLGPGKREYFYYIDHQGQLFLDDMKRKSFITCFKDVGFLSFFFRQLKLNTLDRYAQEFPFISPCGEELNYVRCDDQPIVFTHHLDAETVDATRQRVRSNAPHGYLSYGGTGHRLVVPFQPSKLCMLPSTGRLYHPAPERVGGIGLVKSSFAIEISKYFQYADAADEMACPTHCVWQGNRYLLDNELGCKVVVTSK